ncbi:MAG: hypothetical protein ACRC8D_08570 [Aeromonas sp.]
MKLLGTTIILLALMTYLAAGCLITEGEYLWAAGGAVLGFIGIRAGGWIDHHYVSN